MEEETVPTSPVGAPARSDHTDQTENRQFYCLIRVALSTRPGLGCIPRRQPWRPFFLRPELERRPHRPSNWLKTPRNEAVAETRRRRHLRCCHHSGCRHLAYGHPPVSCRKGSHCIPRRQITGLPTHSMQHVLRAYPHLYFLLALSPALSTPTATALSMHCRLKLIPCRSLLSPPPPRGLDRHRMP